MIAPSSPTITRRKMLLMAGAASASAVVAACGTDDVASEAPHDDGADVDEPGATITAPKPGCVVTPEATEGPFYTDANLVRRDITEGRPGQALEMRVTVVDADGCTPLPDALVDIWHADAGGLYSAFTGQGDGGDIDTTSANFLRGVQNTDSRGEATFDTIYPGWYQGRTTHVHAKVHFADQTRITTQLYFPDDVTAEVYGAAQYAERGQKDTTNSSDEFGGDNRNLLMTVTKEGNRYIAIGTIGIKKA